MALSNSLQNDPNPIAKLALEFREEMRRYGKSVSCSEALNAILANITSIPEDDVFERFNESFIDACLVKKINRARKLKNRIYGGRRS